MTDNNDHQPAAAPPEDAEVPSQQAWEKAVNDHVRAGLGRVTAAADQLEATDRELYALILTLAFAFGVLAAIVALQGRQLRALRGPQ